MCLINCGVEFELCISGYSMIHIHTCTTHAVGHCNPRVVEAFSSQSASFTCDQFGSSDDLLEKYTSHLLTHFPESFGFVFFTNSG